MVREANANATASKRLFAKRAKEWNANVAGSERLFTKRAKEWNANVAASKRLFTKRAKEWNANVAGKRIVREANGNAMGRERSFAMQTLTLWEGKDRLRCKR